MTHHQIGVMNKICLLVCPIRSEIMKAIFLLFLFNTVCFAEENQNLAEQYLRACETPSDIYEHLPTLHSLAKECSSVVEIGVRTMVSSWGILFGLSENPSLSRSYLGIDLEYPPDSIFHFARQLAQKQNIDFQFWQKNDLFINDFPHTELLFIDSLHTYCHLSYELDAFSPKVSKYIAIHDTSWGEIDESYFGDYSEYPPNIDRTKRGLWLAVIDFLQCHPEWALHKRYENNYGFTILRRIR